MSIKEKDFVELEYTGTTEGHIFDTTDVEAAKEAGIYNPQAKYGSIIVIVGENQLLPKLEQSLVGKDPGTYKLELSAEDAFGKKDAKLIQLIPTKKFLDAKIQPHPGLQVNVDGGVGTVKSVSGGRTIVDFNHPLAGKDVKYEVEIKRVITDESEKVKAVVGMLTGKEAKVTVEGKKAKITFADELPDALRDTLTEHIKKQTIVEEVVWQKD